MTEDKNLGWSAAAYAKLAGFDSDWRDTWWCDDTLALLGRRLRFDAVEAMLDVGCGVGHWGQRLAGHLRDDARVVGVDHEPGFLDAARARAARRPQRFEYLAARVEALPFDDGTFDLVTCQTVLMHVADARAALAEMLRVTKPGGLLLAVEPNNLVNAMLRRTAHPRPPFEETLCLLAWEETCIRGKIALGHGDITIGEQLPLLFAELGLDDRRVHSNDQTAWLVPPYDTPAQRAQIEQLRADVAAEHSRYGDRDTALRQYLAGGGDAAAFEALWAIDQASQRAALADLDAGRFTSGGGYLLYVVAGRKPRLSG